MLTQKLLKYSPWLLPLLLQAAHAQDAEQAPLVAETDAASTTLKLVAYVMPSKDITKALETAWATVKATTDFPMEWIGDCPGDERCPDSPLLENAYADIRLYRGGNELLANYNGPRTSDEILRFIDRAKRSSQVPATLTPAEAESFKSVDDFVCIANMDPSENTVRKEFEAVAEKYWTEFTFGIAETPAAEAGAGAAEAKVVCHRRDDESAQMWKSGPDGLRSWIIETSRPVIAELSDANHHRFLDRGWPMVYIFHPSPSARASLRSQLHSFAKGQYSSLTCVTVDPTYFPDLPAKLGLDPAKDGYPVGAVHQLSKRRIYPYPKGRGFTPKEIQGWGLNVWQGRVKPWTPPGQEPANEDAGSGNVRIVGTHNLKVKNIPGLKIKIGGRERDEL